MIWQVLVERARSHFNNSVSASINTFDSLIYDILNVRDKFGV